MIITSIAYTFTLVNGGLLLCGREGSGKSSVLDYLEYKTAKGSQLHTCKSQ
jgi:hypothetical protein